MGSDSWDLTGLIREAAEQKTDKEWSWGEQGLENRGRAETEKIEDGAQEMSNTFGQLVLVVS